MLHGNYSNGQSLQFVFHIFVLPGKKTQFRCLTQKSSGIFPERRFVARFLRRQWRIISCTSINITPHMSIQHVSIECVSIHRVSIQYGPNSIRIWSIRFDSTGILSMHIHSNVSFPSYPFKPCHCISLHVIGSAGNAMKLNIFAYRYIIRHGNEFDIPFHQQELQ